MLTTKCIHPEIIAAAVLCGHGDKILIADGNYPLDAKSGNAKKVYLGVCPGLPTVTQVLESLLSVMNVEKAEVMLPTDGTTPDIFSEFEALLPGVEVSGIDRNSYYDACCLPAVRLAISTGEKRVYGNILITVGVA
jgi:L-fucose mutarotase